jgi:hypothetical protein
MKSFKMLYVHAMFVMLSAFIPAAAFSQVRCENIFSQITHHISSSASATLILQATLQHQGATFFHDRVLGQEDYYIVSIFPEKEVQTPQLTIQMLAQYIEKHQAFLDSDPRLGIGTWHDQKSGDFFLDIVILIDAKNPQAKRIAESLARQYNQLAFFDLKNSQEIRTDDSARSANSMH